MPIDSSSRAVLVFLAVLTLLLGFVAVPTLVGLVVLAELTLV